MARTHNKKNDGKYNEPHELEGLTTPRIDNEKCSQITGQEGRCHDDHGVLDVIEYVVIYTAYPGGIGTQSHRVENLCRKDFGGV